jgi:GT2 family glycosyltransferase
MNAPAISVIIPTWNQSTLLRACLETLAAQTFRDFEVIVVDDGSTEDIAAATAGFGAVLLRLEENGGFARAVNHGIAAARGHALFLLNNDMTLDPACLAHLHATARETGAAMVAPVVCWRDQPGVVYSAGDHIGPGGRPESHGFRVALAEFLEPRVIFGVSAGAGLFDRRIFDTVGALDPAFIAYFEDSDLCFRARLAGFSAALASEARAWHVGSASIAGRTWWRSRQCCRNHALLVLKNMPAGLLLRHAPVILRERLHQWHCCFSAARAEGGAAWALRIMAGTWLEIVAALPHTLRERRRIQRLRILPDREVARLLQPGP